MANDEELQAAKTALFRAILRAASVCWPVDPFEDHEEGVEVLRDTEEKLEEYVKLVRHSDVITPMRGDGFAKWLTEKRNGLFRGTHEWVAVDQMLNEYRLRADTGLPLDEDIEKAGP